MGVLATGGGTNLQAIIDACESGMIPGEVVVVIANKKDAYVLERAKKHNIDSILIDRSKCRNMKEFSDKAALELNNRSVDLVCLAGFLLKLAPSFIAEFGNRILNIHPALLPAFGGEGMYGHHVHEAVLKSGARFSGPTVHFVDEEYDKGAIILQDVVPVMDNDTPESLHKRVLEKEHIIFPKAVKYFCENKLVISGKRVIIKE